MTERARGRAAILAAVALSLAACTSIFGIEDGTLVEGGAGDAASTVEGGGTPAEGGGSDVAHDSTSAIDAQPDQTVNDGPPGGETGADHVVPETGADVTNDVPDTTDGPSGTDGPNTSDGPPAQGDAGVGKVGTLGDACSSPGATACNGNDSQVVLICQGGAWAVSSTCSSTQRCDSTVGACASVATGCSGLQPGARFCSGNALLQCGVDLTSTTAVQTCGAHQTCSSSALSCTCNAAPECTKAGSTCGPDASVTTCQVDGQGCLYFVSDQACGSACVVDAGSATCCTNDPDCESMPSTGCNSGALTKCQLGTDGCYHETTYACGSGFTCMQAQLGAYCGCTGAASCAGSSDGTECVADQYGEMGCGCSTSADCLNGACCYTQQSTPLCYPNGGGLGGKTCVNGVWQ